ncbi:MAG: hypothetical protein Q7S30_04565 [Candidatus Omnitrophota bacterium]|nr:hypothetical protein [Candidatus Omnitrophota bacterium]
MRKNRVVFFVAGLLVAASTIVFAEEIKVVTIVPSQAAIRGSRGAIGSTYKDMADSSIGADNFLVQGVVRADGGLVIQKVASQTAEDAMTKTTGQIWLRTDIV